MENRNLPSQPLDEPGALHPAFVEETLVTDVRASLTPAQMVERRLASLLQTAPPPVGRRDATALLRAHF